MENVSSLPLLFPLQLPQSQAHFPLPATPCPARVSLRPATPQSPFIAGAPTRCPTRKAAPPCPRDAGCRQPSRHMDCAMIPCYGGASSSEPFDPTRIFLGVIDHIANEQEPALPITIVDLACQSQYTHIAASMRKMAAKYNGPQKQQFQIPVKHLFTKALSSILGS